MSRQRPLPPSDGPAPPQPAGHHIVFVTGKGGVGKSMVAAASALQLARQGLAVQLVELGSHSFFGPLLGLEVGVEPVPWKDGVAIARWDVESSLREYLAHYLVFKMAADKVLSSTAMQALVAAAPGVAEMALLGKLTAPMRHRWYTREADVVVVDGYATGQFMAMLRAPVGLAATAAEGALHRHAQTTARLLADPALCEYRIVTLAEEMTVTEACEMAQALQAELGIAPRLLCNRLIELPETLPTLPPADPAAPFVDHMQRVAQRQRESLAALEGLGAARRGPVIGLPLVPSTSPDQVLQAMADTLDAAGPWPEEGDVGATPAAASNAPAAKTPRRRR